MKSTVESHEAQSVSLQSRLSDSQGLLKLLLNIENECRNKAERENSEQAGRLKDMATLEKKSVQYKEVCATLCGYACTCLHFVCEM